MQEREASATHDGKRTVAHQVDNATPRVPSERDRRWEARRVEAELLLKEHGEKELARRIKPKQVVAYRKGAWTCRTHASMHPCLYAACRMRLTLSSSPRPSLQRKKKREQARRAPPHAPTPARNHGCAHVQTPAPRSFSAPFSAPFSLVSMLQALKSDREQASAPAISR